MHASELNSVAGPRSFPAPSILLINISQVGGGLYWENELFPFISNRYFAPCSGRKANDWAQLKPSINTITTMLIGIPAGTHAPSGFRLLIKGFPCANLNMRLRSGYFSPHTAGPLTTSTVAAPASN